LIRELKERCDIVIIDSPPVLSLTDAQVLSSLADGVVMVVAADTTPLPHVQRSQAMLRHVGGRLLGVIFHKAKAYNNPDVWDGYYNYYTYNQTDGNARSLTAPKNLLTK
jgi:Mrp family chromosome partitioning ATPase